MCNQLAKEELFRLFTQVFSQGQDELSLHRLKQQLVRHPKQAFSNLLIDYFGLQSQINGDRLEKFLFPLADELYLGILIFLNELERLQLHLVHQEMKPEYYGQLPYIRRFCRAMLVKALASPALPFTGRKRIQTALAKMLDIDRIMQQINLEKKLPFDGEEVFGRINIFLAESDVLADLPDFLPVYFRMDELEPIKHDLSSWTLNPFSRLYLQRLLNERKKHQILLALKKIIYQFPVIYQAKQAYAVYLSLSNMEWVDHPFIRRLIANSFLEWQVEMLSGKLDLSGKLE